MTALVWEGKCTEGTDAGRLWTSPAGLDVGCQIRKWAWMNKEEFRRRRAQAAARKGLSLRLVVIGTAAVGLIGWVWMLSSAGA